MKAKIVNFNKKNLVPINYFFLKQFNKKNARRGFVKYIVSDDYQTNYFQTSLPHRPISKFF